MGLSTIPVQIANTRIGGALTHRAKGFERFSPLVAVGVKEYLADYQLTAKDYDLFQVQVLLTGALELAIPGKTIRLKAGDGVVYRLGSTYTIRTCETVATVLYCTMRGDTRLSFRGTASWFTSDGMMLSLAGLLREACGSPDNRQNLWLLAALGEAFAAHAERLAPGRKRRGNHADYVDAVVQRARELLEASVYSGRSPREQLAAIGLSYGHVARLFRARTGKSPKQYQVEARLALARRLLENSTFSIRAVAEELQFCSPQHFSREFGKHCGQSPQEYQRAHGASGGGKS